MKTPYSEIRVSHLIKKANISRASFYLYFEGKDDLFYCMLKREREQMINRVIEAFRKGEGGFLESMKQFAHSVVEDKVGAKYGRLYTQVMESEECGRIASIVEKEFFNSCSWKKSGEDCYRAMDRTRYPKLDEEILTHAISIGVLAIAWASVQNYIGSVDIEKLKQPVLRQLEILDHGIRA